MSAELPHSSLLVGSSIPKAHPGHPSGLEKANKALESLPRAEEKWGIPGWAQGLDFLWKNRGKQQLQAVNWPEQGVILFE